MQTKLVRIFENFPENTTFFAGIEIRDDEKPHTEYLIKAIITSEGIMIPDSHTTSYISRDNTIVTVIVPEEPFKLLYKINEKKVFFADYVLDFEIGMTAVFGTVKVFGCRDPRSIFLSPGKKFADQISKMLFGNDSGEQFLEWSSEAGERLRENRGYAVRLRPK